ncbi:MAG: sigma-70 family RNA polymerase sigma factor [Planctomycetes bacterium]|nr:sigma-70 family RNA polymerase sigma factor [Planctomycetota bacterium]
MNEDDWIGAALARHEPALLAYARRLTGDPDAARDVVQDTFLKLCRQARSNVEPHLAEWLFTVCRNAAHDLHRKGKRMSALSEDQMAARTAEVEDPASVAAASDADGGMLALLAKLPPRQQEALRLKFHGGLSYKEIAGVMQTSIGNVGFLVHVGLRSLRERMAVEAVRQNEIHGGAA